MITLFKIFLKYFLKPIITVFYSLIKEFKLKRKYSNLKLSGSFSIKNTKFGNYNYIENATLLNSKIDDFSYVASGTIINYCKIGKFSCIGPDVKIGLGEHPVKDFVSIHPAFYSSSVQRGITFSDKNYFNEFNQTIIGNDVWIGARAIIKSGIVIGDGAIIAAGAIVTKNVEPYCIIGGVPGKIIRKRFSEEEIKKLIALRWWDKEVNWLKKNYSLMQNINNIELF